MKMNHRLALISALVMLVCGCKKVELLAPESNAILPLAIGNTWEYVDTMIIETSLPSIDTLLASISYTVVGQVYIDHLETENGKKTVKRTLGWDFRNDGAYDFGNTLFPVGNSIYSSRSYPYQYYSSIQFCGFSISPLFAGTQPEIFVGIGNNLAKSIVYPISGVAALPSYPAFRDRPNCLNSLNVSISQATFDIFYEPLAPTDSLVQVATEAGIFTCADYGREWWSPGVGMVKCIQTGTAAFYDANHIQRTGTLRWTRTLRGFHLN